MTLLEKELTRILLTIKSIDKETPLMMVDNAKDSKILIDLGADVNAVSTSVEDYFYEFSVLSCAKDAEQAKVILDAGVDINFQVNKMRNIDLALFYAKDAEHTKVLLEAGADPNALSRDSHILMNVKNLDQMKVLLKAGANPNWVCPESKFSTLMHKCYFGPFDPVFLTTLLDSGADPKHLDNTGNTHLMRLLNSYCNKDINVSDMILILVKAGVDVNHVVINDYWVENSALSLANNPEYVKLLIKLGAKVNNSVKGFGSESFIKSFLQDSFEISKVLFEHGAYINSKRYNGITALHFAKTEEQVKFLIENGADVNAKATDGTTSLTNADPKKRKLLIDAGAIE